MKKRIITSIFTLIFVLVCTVLCSCAAGHDALGDTVNISVLGAAESRRLTIYATNETSGEQVKIQVKKKDEYVSSLSLLPGNYIIEKIKTNNEDYEIDPVTTRFIIEEGKENLIVIEVKEKSVEGTLMWFLKRNAFIITALVCLCIALAIVKYKKGHKATIPSAKMQ